MIIQRILPSSSSQASVLCRCIHFSRVQRWHEYDNARRSEIGEEGWSRLKNNFLYEIKRWKRRYLYAKYDPYKRKNPIAFMRSPQNKVFHHEYWPGRTEVLIIGGGLTGSAAAFWIKQRLSHNAGVIFRVDAWNVVVVESPSKFDMSRSLLSSGIITQQFSTPEFVEMTLFTAEFLRHAGEHLQIEDNDPPDINILPMGFMHLANTSEHADYLQNCWKMQIEKGAKIAFWTKDELEQNFPFMNFDGIVAGTYGLENEGCVDNWQLLSALREKNISLGVEYIKGEIEGFQYRRDVGSNFADIHGFVDTEDADIIKQHRMRLVGVYVRPEMECASPRIIQAHKIVNAAGPFAGEIAEIAGFGKGRGLMSVPVPIKKRKRSTYLIHAPDCPDLLNMPAFFDPSGVFCRPNDMGYNFVCGRIPTKEEDFHINHDDLTVDYNEFYEKVWPVLTKRIPLFKNIKVINGWAHLNDVNIWDDAPLLGEHLQHRSFYTMAGFGSYGPQMSIAAGRAFAEKYYDEAYTSVNVRAWDMRRIMAGTKTLEPLKCF